MTDSAARVLLVDDHAVVRAGFGFLLKNQGEYQIHEASSSEEAYRIYDDIMPDIVVMDISMPGMGGLEGLRRLRCKHPDARVLLLSMYDDRAYVARALKMGARGYLSKNSAAEALPTAVSEVLAGGYYFEDGPGRGMQRDDDTDTDILGLSAREFEIFRLLAEGRGVGDIASSLNLSPKTVSNHRGHLMDKLKLKTTAELVHFAIRQGLVNA